MSWFNLTITNRAWRCNVSKLDSNKLLFTFSPTYHKLPHYGYSEGTHNFMVFSGGTPFKITMDTMVGVSSWSQPSVVDDGIVHQPTPNRYCQYSNTGTFMLLLLDWKMLLHLERFLDNAKDLCVCGNLRLAGIPVQPAFTRVCIPLGVF